MPYLKKNQINSKEYGRTKRKKRKRYKLFMCFYKDKTVAILSQMEKDKPVELANRIIESIKVK
jgi:hypothetical protein